MKKLVHNLQVSTSRKRQFGVINPFLLLFMLLVSALTLRAQTQYSSIVVSESHVSSSNSNIDANENTYSELESSSGLALGLGSYSSHIELSFPSIVPANQTSYVRIECEDAILSSLMGGTLGNLLSTVSGVALTGNQEFTVSVKNGPTEVLSGSSAVPSTFSGENLKVVIDANNHTYLAITPTQPYQTVRITNLVGGLVGLGIEKTLRVWDLYYVLNAPNCDHPEFTSFDGDGISLELLNLGGGVTNLSHAIDNNLSSHSTISLGVVSTASSLIQRIYFEGASQSSDQFAVRFGLDPALLALTLGQGIFIRTQLGSTIVSTQNLENILTPAAIDSIQNGLPATIYLSPNAPVDRIVIGYVGVLGVALNQSLEIYEVYKLSQPPVLDVLASSSTICEGSTAVLQGTTSNPTNVINWYTSMSSTSPVGTTASASPYTTGALMSDTTLYIASAIPGCPGESARIPVPVDVIPGPDPSVISIPVSPNYCGATSVSLQATSTLGSNFQWFLTPNGTSPITNGQQSGGQTFTVNNGSITISGLSPANSPYTIYAGIQDPVTLCWSVPNDYASATLVILDELPPTTLQTIQSFCATSEATLADLQIAGGLITWYDAPTNGNPLPATTELQNATSYYASSTGAFCESSQLLEITAMVNDEPAPTTGNANQSFCVSESATIADLQISGGMINWYDMNGNSVSPTLPLVNGASYFATSQGALCESSDTLEILATINDEPAPTTGNANQSFCVSESATIADLQISGGTINWYDVNGNSVSPTLPLVNGASYFATSQGALCESSDTLEISATINDEPAPTTGNANQSFCVSESATIADLQISGGTINWYDVNGNSVSPTLPLVNGASYFATNQGALCESSDTLEITALVSDEPTPTTNDPVQHFCLSDNATIADLQLTGGVINWYDNSGNPLVSNLPLIDGQSYFATNQGALCESSDSLEITVSIGNLPAPTGNTLQTFCEANSPTVADITLNETTIIWEDALGNPVSLTTPLVNNASYFATLVSATCQSLTQLEVVTQFEFVPAPTTNDTSQDFCSTSSTVADLQINQPNIIWYDAPVGGNIVSPTVQLQDGVSYFAAQLGVNCESEDRLEIVVSIENLPAPTGDALQVFCEANDPTVGDLLTNETNIVWEDALGNSLSLTTPLVNNNSYFASLNGVNCQSATSLEVVVQFETIAAPTTTDATQDFCNQLVTIADLATNESNVVWYTSPSGGVALDPSTVLQDGVIYYAAQLGVNCESEDRLAVAVSIDPLSVPTSDDLSQTFCSQVAPSVADLDVNESNVIWFDENGNQVNATTPLVNDGLYYAVATNGSCQSEDSLAIMVQIVAPDSIELEGPISDICMLDTVTYSVAAGMQNYDWTVNGGTIVSGGGSTDNTVTVVWQVALSNTLQITYDNLAGCDLSYLQTIDVSSSACSDLSIEKTVDNQTPFIGETITFTITVSNSGNQVFSNIEVDEQIQSGFTFVSYQASEGTYNSTTGIWTLPTVGANTTETLQITVVVNPTGSHVNVASLVLGSFPGDLNPGNDSDEVVVEPDCFTVYNEISPNGDGENDFLSVDCLEQYPNNSISIFNRYGNEVYASNSYQNNWDGVANVKGTVGRDEPLPAGTYFYILKVDDGEAHEMSGWVYIVR